MYFLELLEMKKNKVIDSQIKINKKDSTGLFSGKFKKQEFADKKDKLEKEFKKQEKNRYFS